MRRALCSFVSCSSREARFTGLALSVVFVFGGVVLLPPVGAQIDPWFFVSYLALGPILTALSLWLLYRHDPKTLSKSNESKLNEFAPIGAVFLAIFGLFGFLISAERQARVPFLDKQLASCADIADIVGTLATTSIEDETWKAYDAKFWVYYWGRRALFEDRSLEDRMEQFVDFLKIVENKQTTREARNSLQQSALCVTHTCKGLARVAWSVVPGLIRSPEAEPDPHCAKADELHSKLFGTSSRKIPGTTYLPRRRHDPLAA
jgi:hypothetical protein